MDALRSRMLPFYRTWLAIRDLEVPTIAAVNGAAIGAGLAVALACDLRYAAEDAKLGVPFTALGMHPGMATTYLLPEVAGLAVARELLLTGRIVTGAEAAASGLVDPGRAARRGAGHRARGGRRGGGRRAGRDPADQAGAAGRRARELRGGAGVGGAGPAGDAGDGRPAGGPARPAGEAPAAVHRPLSRCHGIPAARFARRTAAAHGAHALRSHRRSTFTWSTGRRTPRSPRTARAGPLAFPLRACRPVVPGASSGGR